MRGGRKGAGEWLAQFSPVPDKAPPSSPPSQQPHQEHDVVRGPGHQGAAPEDLQEPGAARPAGGRGGRLGAAPVLGTAVIWRVQSPPPPLGALAMCLQDVSDLHSRWRRKGMPRGVAGSGQLARIPPVWGGVTLWVLLFLAVRRSAHLLAQPAGHCCAEHSQLRRRHQLLGRHQRRQCEFGGGASVGGGGRCREQAWS